jgi:EmrB/QacA subfamily drug resistance transporter
VEYRWVVLSVTTVGVFMAGLDTRIVLIGLPTIAESLRTDLETVLWVTQGYQIAITIGLLFLGRFSDIFGRVKIYNWGFMIFTLGSAFCAFAQTGVQLIIFRIIQGVGGAILLVNSHELITDATPAGKLGFALGINQIAWILGAVLGLTVGGVLVDTTGWRTVFAVNIPVGIFGTLWAHIRLREISHGERYARFDILGFCLFTTSLTSLLLVISLATMGAVNSIESAMFYLVSLVTFGLFLYIEPRRTDPLLDMRLFRIRLFSAGSVSQFLSSVGLGSLSLIIILYFQIIRGYDALIAGLLFLPLDLAFVSIAPISGRLSDEYGARWLATLGMGVATIGYVAFAFVLSATTSLLEIVIMLIIVGLGWGLFASPNIRSIMESVPAQHRGVASGVRATIMNAGNVISIGLVAYIITTVIPYQVVSGIITGGYTALNSVESMGFVAGIQRAFIVTAAMTLAAMFASSLRGEQTLRLTKEPDLGDFESKLVDELMANARDDGLLDNEFRPRLHIEATARFATSVS